MDVVQNPAPRRARRGKVWLLAAGALAVAATIAGVALVASRPAPALATVAFSGASGQAVANGAAPGPRKGAALGIDTVITGTVVSFDGKTLVVKADGQSGTVSFTLAARLQARLSSADPKDPGRRPAPGDRIVVAASGTSPNLLAQFVRVIHPRVVGTVTAVDGSTLRVLDPRGFQFTVDISAVTNPPSFTAGDHILAVGTVTGADTLRATKVTKNLRAAVRSQWPGWGGPHRHRPGSAPQQPMPGDLSSVPGFSAA